MSIMEFLRQFRIGKIALFDLTLAYVGIYFLSPWLTKLAKKINLSIGRKEWLWLTLPIGVITHLLIGQETALNKMLFNINGNYLSKIILIFMIYMGLRGVRKIKKPKKTTS